MHSLKKIVSEEIILFLVLIRCSACIFLKNLDKITLRTEIENIADLKYTVATDNCADRAALSDGLRDVLTATQAQTQRILDQLCQDKIDAKNDTINQLRQELLYARGQASQDVQTAVLRQGQVDEVDALYNRLSNCPVPSTPVYGRTPIFTASNGCSGCGCGSSF